MTAAFYEFVIPPAAHWSLRVKRGTLLRLTDVDGGGNLGMLLYNPYDLLEKYNAPDTLKCQHTFKLQRGHCLYSDMGRIFCSIVADSHGWHDTVCGNSQKAQIEERWGPRDYQSDRNDWQQNGYDSFLVELAKYGLGEKDLAANINWFSKVTVDDEGNLALDEQSGSAGNQVDLRFEMDTLVVMHSCPHPMNSAADYPRRPIKVELMQAEPVTDDDYCKNFRPENQRGFENNRLYHFLESAGG